MPQSLDKIHPVPSSRIGIPTLEFRITELEKRLYQHGHQHERGAHDAIKAHRVGRTATRVVAASNSTSLDKIQADYICDGTKDEVEIQKAIDAIGTRGGHVVCLPGTYEIDSTITVDHQYKTGYLLFTAHGAFFNHAGSGYCFEIQTNQSGGGGSNVPERYTEMQGIRITGTNSGAGGIQVDSCMRCGVRDFWIDDYSAGVGIDLYSQTGICEYSYIHRGHIDGCLNGIYTRVENPWTHDGTSFRDIDISSTVVNSIMFRLEGGMNKSTMDNCTAHLHANGQVGWEFDGATNGLLCNQISVERHDGATQKAIDIGSTPTTPIVFIYLSIWGSPATLINNPNDKPYVLIESPDRGRVYCGALYSGALYIGSPSDFSGAAVIRQDKAASENVVLTLANENDTSNNDIILEYAGKDDGGNLEAFGRAEVKMTNHVHGSETGEFWISLKNNPNWNTALKVTADGSVYCGVLSLEETTTPAAVPDFGKVYTKNDNKLYFQDGAGSEHEIAFV